MDIVDLDELQVILTLLNHCENRTLKQTYTAFVDAVQLLRRFRFCHALAFLIKDKHLLKTTQRIAALALIYHGSKPLVDVGSLHPFSSYLIHIVGDEERDLVERVLANSILQGNVDEQIFEQSPEAYVSSNSLQSPDSLPSRMDLENKYIDNTSQSINLSCFRLSSKDPIVFDTDSHFLALPEFSSTHNSSPTPTPTISPSSQMLSNQSRHTFEPNSLHSATPMTQIRPHNDISPPDIPLTDSLLNDSDILNENVESEYEQLVTQACESTLNATQLKRAQFLLQAHPSLAVRHRLKSDVFGKCLESNRDFVESVLKSAIRSADSFGSGMFSEYLDLLVRVNASLNSLEVVGRLALEDGLPQEFLQTYFSHVINECLQLKDEGLQNRRVKLVCVMFLNLIKKQVMVMESNQELCVELMNFCVQFSNVNEATALFRVLRQNMNESKEDNQEQGG
eukprot:TRINITY_DN83762_c0_g1_i5.p1 TRINITY_DN83762_c0_g1~~TRINITY_DN83762_c0_g1_i5.p1  ORF type:complete len:452 (-),score=40.47 TRINITY_DN83762_c0_g1_i5:255-1610(-)